LKMTSIPANVPSINESIPTPQHVSAAVARPPKRPVTNLLKKKENVDTKPQYLHVRIPSPVERKSKPIVYDPNAEPDYAEYDRHSPDSVDYETSVEYAEHLKFIRAQRVEDYSKNLSDSGEESKEDDA